MRYYPVFLDLADEPCVVLGEGKLAAEKAAGLREAGAAVRVIASKDYRRGDLAGARLVFDASDDPAVNRESWAEAEAAGILINVVDRPAQCRFIAPAIVRRDPLLIAISTEGQSPFLASTLRARLERWLGREWGPFTALIGRTRRELRELGIPIQQQTKIYKRLLASDIRKMLRNDDISGAQHAAAAISRADLGAGGRVALVGAGPGDPDLLTVRARELLGDADFVLHDALVSAETLALCGPEARLEDVGKRAGRRSARQAEITARLIELARQGHHHRQQVLGAGPAVNAGGVGDEDSSGLNRGVIRTNCAPLAHSGLALSQRVMLHPFSHCVQMVSAAFGLSQGRDLNR